MDAKREALKRWFLDEPDRTVALPDGNLYKCEGQAYRPHKCSFGFDLNEVVFTKRHFQTLSEAEKRYFWHEINCSLNCGWFHHKLGHTTKFREWHLERVVDLYGHTEVTEYIVNAPVIIKSPLPA
ncbi:hypothetical protein KAR91_36600 [Candidatus Pacearchaeota archaeon]|nr:hypothetical protein [Candidatus Pacearchaeota archaeon]